jgi:tetratricopeptide (TPR) repeat protein
VIRAPLFYRLLICIASTLTCAATSARAGDLRAVARQLGDADPSVRAQAAQALISAGEAGREAVRALVDDLNPELAAAARCIANRLAPLDPLDVADPPPLARYRGAADPERRGIIEELNGPAGAAIIARMWGIERHAAVRETAFLHMLDYPGPAAAALRAEGNSTVADLLLSEAIRNFNTGAVEAYVEDAVARGRIDSAIAQWSARGERGTADPRAQQVLAHLYRAKGERELVLKCAKQADDPRLLESVLAANGDWASFAAVIRRRPQQDLRVPDFALLAACDDLSDNTAAFNSDVQSLLNGAVVPNDVQIAAHALVMCDRPDDAAHLLAEHRLKPLAFDLLAARGLLDAAMELLAGREQDFGSETTQLRISAARALDRAGEHDRATQFLSLADKGAQAERSPDLLFLLASGQRACGKSEQAWDTYAQAFSQTADDSPQVRQMASAFVGREYDIDWFTLWLLLKQTFPDDQPPRNFQRLRSIYDRTMPLDQLRDLSHWNGHGPLQTAVRGHLALEVAQRIAEEKGPRAAQDLVAAESKRAGSPQVMQRLADIAADRGDWPAAAQWYTAAWESDRTQPLPMYLRGYALARCGSLAAAREAADTARVLSLGDPRKRYYVIDQLERRGMDSEAAAEAEVLHCTAPPMSLYADFGARFATRAAHERGDAAGEAELLRSSIVHLAAGAFTFVDPTSYLALTLRQHAAAAHAALLSANTPAMEQQIEAALRLVPTDITIAIELVPDLEKRGEKQKADALFDRCLTEQKEHSQRSPNAATWHNQIAWLQAECDRQLDDALLHAKRAVELEPKHTAYLDTLAEVYFKQHNYDAAIEQISKCIELEPKDQRHRKQLEKVKSARERQ